MATRAEALAALAQVPLQRSVAVAETAGKQGEPRRSYTFVLPNGGACIIEIDATPSDRQLQDLAAHLPLLTKDRAAALAKFREP